MQRAAPAKKRRLSTMNGISSSLTACSGLPALSLSSSASSSACSSMASARRSSASARPPGLEVAQCARCRAGLSIAASVNEQPNAPYLEAVAAYAFRGPARYHVPGHKGGAGADPGVRKAIGVDALVADVPQDVHGIDL